MFAARSSAQSGESTTGQRAALAQPPVRSLHDLIAPTYPADAATWERASSGADNDEPGQRWYGWQILATDGAALALTAIWLSDPDDLWLPAVTAAGLLTLGAPIVHWSHGKLGVGFLSLGARAVAIGAFVFGLGSLIVAEEDRSVARRGYALVGLACAGLLAMSIADVAVLAFEKSPRRPQYAPLARLTLTPWVDPRARTYGLGAAVRW